MELPKIVDTKPVIVDLEAGSHYWCSCGLSAKEPFCDGAHKGTGFKSVRFELEEPKKVALCACRRTAGQPFCDGAHKNL